MRLKINHFKITIIIAFLLSLVTVIATYLSGNWNTRAIYNIFYITFFNFTILLLNTLFFTRSRAFIGEKTGKFLRISFLIIYSSVYFFATTSFLATGQITKIQTVLFLSQINSAIITAAILGGLVLGILVITTLLYKGISIDPSEKKERKRLKFAFYVSLGLFGLTILTNAYYLQIEEAILQDKEALANYIPEELNLQERVLDINFTKERPNIIFIPLESVSAKSLGFYGYKRNVTSNIDRLAEKSIVFTRAYTTATHSDYALPGLLSSRYLLTSKYRTVTATDSPRKFIWDILKEDNYTTGHHSSQDERWQNMDKYFNYTNLDNWTNSLSDGVTDYGTGRAKKDFDFKATDRALVWMNNTIGKNQSFYLYLNYQATHNPLIYPEEYALWKPDEDNGLGEMGGKDTENMYSNAVRYVDAQVGRIIDFLEENNEMNNTIIIITADHGHDIYDLHGIGGHGNALYNEELRIPAIFYLPGVEPQIIDEPVSHIDFVPTILDLLGYELPDEFQGEVMKKGRPIYSITQSHKYLISIILNDTKIIADINRKILEIYELDEDFLELENIEYSEKYENEVLRLLLWDYCQKDYFQNERWEGSLNPRCDMTNNFKL
jgi:phosphoglycerol transferase MdoB-like AlkP superfamily enzyme